MKVDREHCRAQALQLNETNDCTVRACAVVTQIDYATMHEYLAAHGRKPRSGMYGHAYRKALAEVGYDLTQLQGPTYEYREHYVEGCERYDRRTGRYYWVNGHYRRSRVLKKGSGIDYQSGTVKTLQRELTDGVYLVNTDGHVLALVDGEVHDFTNERRHRIESVFRVTEGTGQITKAKFRI